MAAQERKRAEDPETDPGQRLQVPRVFPGEAIQKTAEEADPETDGQQNVLGTAA